MGKRAVATLRRDLQALGSQVFGRINATKRFSFLRSYTDFTTITTDGSETDFNARIRTIRCYTCNDDPN